MKKKYPKSISCFEIHHTQKFTKPDDKMIVYSDEEKQSFINRHPGKHIKVSNPKWKELKGNIIKKLWYIFTEWLFFIISATIGIIGKELIEYFLKMATNSNQ